MNPRTSTARARRLSAAAAADPDRDGTSQSAPAWALPEGASLGPGHVLQPEGAGAPLSVLLGDGRLVEPVWALPYRYEAQPGDLLLIVSRGERHYALSVLQGRGQRRLAFRGDALVRAEGGALRLRGDRGVRLAGPRVSLRAQALETVARVVHQKLGELSSRIKGRLFERAGSSRRVIEEDDWHSAGERTLVAEDSLLFNGDLIRVS